MRIGIIGFGDLGRSLITGFIKRGISQDDILICDISDRAVRKAHLLGVNNTDTDSLVAKSDAIIFAIDKDAFNKMDIDGTKFMGKIVISCMAEIKFEQLKKIFPTQIVRVIPTIAAENGAAVSGICFDEYADNKDEIKALFSKVGTVIECAESDMPQLTALAACGLCYAAYIINSFINTAENLGFSYEQGKDIVEKTFAAALEMGDYEFLIGRIAGRGGVTIKGVDVMNEGNVHKTIDTAFKTAYSVFLK